MKEPTQYDLEQVRQALSEIADSSKHDSLRLAEAARKLGKHARGMVDYFQARREDR